jgi:hypothetical protein
MPDEDGTEGESNDIDPGQDSDRTEGVDFTDVDPILEDASYPITVDDLVSEHGDATVERTNADPISIRDLLGEMDGDTSFESADGARETMLTMMPQDSVGEPGQSDRGPAGDEYQEQEDESG